VAKVDFNINPGYNKPTASVREPEAKAGAVFEYSMGRRFPCYITVHFRTELNLPSIEIQYSVQDTSKTARRIIVDLPVSGSTLRRPKQVDFEAEPARNGWVNCHQVPEVTYMTDVEPPAEAMAAIGSGRAGRPSRPKAKAKGQAGLARRAPSPGQLRNQPAPRSSPVGNAGRQDVRARGSTPPAVRKERCESLKSMVKSGESGLGCEELSVILTAGDPNLTCEDVQSLFELLDKDEQGKVSFAQMCELLYE